MVWVSLVASSCLSHSYLNASIGSMRLARVAGSRQARSPTTNSNVITREKVSRSSGFTLNSRLESSGAIAAEHTAPQHCSQRDEYHALPQDHAQDVRAVGAQRHAHANLICRLLHRAGSHAVD